MPLTEPKSSKKVWKNIPRVVIAATQSSSGKTTVVTGILRALKNKGLNVQPYKVGPDYLEDFEDDFDDDFDDDFFEDEKAEEKKSEKKEERAEEKAE